MIGSDRVLQATLDVVQYFQYLLPIMSSQAAGHLAEPVHQSNTKRTDAIRAFEAPSAARRELYTTRGGHYTARDFTAARAGWSESASDTNTGAGVI